MTIRNRLKLIGLVPIALLILLSSYFFITSYINFEKANVLKTVLKNNAILTKALTSLGKERGLTALYIGSDYSEFQAPLLKQRKIIDKNLKQLQEKLVTQHQNYIPKLLELIGKKKGFNNTDYAKVLSNISQLQNIRKDVDKQSAEFKDIFFDKYTKKINTLLLNTLIKIKNYSLDTEISSLVSSLIQLYISKENAGLERGFISYYIAQKRSMSFDDIARWDKFKTKANSFNINELSNINVIRQLKNIFQSSQAKHNLAELDMTSSSIQTDMDTGRYAADMMEWFSLQSKKITLLSKAELVVSSALWKKSDIFLQKQFLLLLIAGIIWILSFILAYLGSTTTRDITRNIKELEDVLNKAVHEMKKNDEYLSMETMAIENIELDTHAGTKEAYKFLETLVEQAKDDKLIALQANEAKSLFLANMSHEIRTPLNGIVGFTEILRSTELTEEQNEFLSIIDKSSENLLSIINNILDLSKIESNKIEIENIIFDAEEEFESAVETYAVAATEKNINLNYYMDPTISSKLKGDPTKIKEVVINLLSNAVKFTSYGGEINLEIMKIVGDDGTSRVKFSVKDDGIGMTKDQQSRIFDAFSQADVSVTRKYGGTGLGLTISSQFVELMGGLLELESAKDQGTTFFFSLPLEEVISTEVNYAYAFSDLTIAKYEQDVPSKLDTYIQHYFDFFGPEIKHFHSIVELKDIQTQTKSSHFWIDVDKAEQSIIDNIKSMDKSKLILLANLTSRDKIERLNIDQSNVLFKPITLSKIKDILNKSTNNTAKVLEEKNKKLQTKFSAKVLVTEDNIINQKLIKRILEEHGISVDIANNGLESFEKRRSGDYELIFMDIQMPVMDGIEATHEILDYEEDEEQEHIPIIALTANALKGDRERFLAEGMDEYITKPIETTELLYILNKFLSHKSHTVEHKSDTQEIKKEIPKPPKVKEQKALPKDDDIAPVNNINIPKAVKETPSVEEIAIKKAPVIEKTIQAEATIKATKPKKILIVKKLLLERRVLAKILDNLNLEYEIITNMSVLKDRLQAQEADMLFIDASLLSAGLLAYSKIAIIASSKPNETVNKKIVYGEHISSTASKDDIKNIIMNYRG